MQNNNDYCYNCKTALLYPKKPCPNCGYKNTKSNNWLKNIVRGITFIIIVAILIIILPIIMDFFSSITSASTPDCNDSGTKELVIEIFKEHNPDYINIDVDSISDIQVENTRVSSYDPSIKKYTCEGDIVIKPKEDGFYYSKNYCNKVCNGIASCESSCIKNGIPQKDKPSSVKFYGQSFQQTPYNTERKTLSLEYRCKNIEYTSQLADGTKHYVTATTSPNYVSDDTGEHYCNFN